MRKKRTRDVGQRLDEASSQIAVALRKTLKKYGNFVDELIKVQRAVDNVRSAQQSLFHAIDGKVRDITTYYDAGVTPPDSFVGELYSAITNTSFRKWTREHIAVVKKAVAEKASVERKIAKLRDRAALEKPGTPEAAATAALLTRQRDVRDALASRIDFAVRKFLELRQCVLQGLIGSTEMLYAAVGNDVPTDILREHPVRRFMEGLTDADNRAIRLSPRTKGVICK